MRLTKRELEAKLLKEYFVENEEDFNLVDLGASMEGYMCFRTKAFCHCGKGIYEDIEERDSLLITMGDYIKMMVTLCPKCAAKRVAKAKPFEVFIAIAKNEGRKSQ